MAGGIIFSLFMGLFSLLAIFISAWQLKCFFPEEKPFRDLLPCVYLVLGACFVKVLLSIVL